MTIEQLKEIVSGELENTENVPKGVVVNNIIQTAVKPLASAMGI